MCRVRVSVLSEDEHWVRAGMPGTMWVHVMCPTEDLSSWWQILCERLCKVHEETEAEVRREPSSKEEQNQAPAVLLGLKKPGALVACTRMYVCS